MKNYLSIMLDKLTSAYSLKDCENVKRELPIETNIGKLFSIFAWGLDLAQEQLDKILSWDDLDNACGTTLDRFGKNFGVSRDGADDWLYRQMIKIKMISQLFGGDIDAIITAASGLFNIDPAEIDLQEIFPASIWLYIDEDKINTEHMDAASQIKMLLKRITVAGVGAWIFLKNYRSGESHEYYAVPTVVCNDVSASLQGHSHTGTVSSHLACATWEETVITSKTMKGW